MTDFEVFKTQLEHYLSQQMDKPVSIIHAAPLAGGASRDSWVLAVQMGDTTQRLVLRKDYPTQMNENALTRAQEFAVMQRAHETGVKVARVRYLCTDAQVLGFPFFLMDYVEGISIGRKVITQPELAAARAVLPEQMAQQLAQIHTMPVDDLNFLARPANHDPIGAVIAECYALLDALQLHNPAFEFILRWADRHRPACDRITFIHGDFRVGNLLVDLNGLAAVIDWEFAHIGDPHEEIGYVCMRDWRFGNGHLRMGGLSDRERLITAYEQASGFTVNRQAADWWELIGNVRWGIICMSQAQRHLSGKESSVELASLGRRSAEMQLEALQMINLMGV